MKRWLKGDRELQAYTGISRDFFAQWRREGLQFRLLSNAKTTYLYKCANVDDFLETYYKLQNQLQ